MAETGVQVEAEQVISPTREHERGYGFSGGDGDNWVDRGKDSGRPAGIVRCVRLELRQPAGKDQPRGA
jgi:hypothetical protein